jgi:hypothetical protein
VFFKDIIRLCVVYKQIHLNEDFVVILKVYQFYFIFIFEIFISPLKLTCIKIHALYIDAENILTILSLNCLYILYNVSDNIFGLEHNFFNTT